MKRSFVFCLTILSAVLISSVTASKSFAINHQIISSDSTYAITGTVVNAETNAIISDATVAVADSDLSSTTDETGSFTIEGLDQGTYTLTVSAEGYQETQIKVNVGDDMQRVIIKLSPEKNDDNK